MTAATNPQIWNGVNTIYHDNWKLDPLLLTWFNFNPSMDKKSHAQ